MSNNSKFNCGINSCSSRRNRSSNCSKKSSNSSIRLVVSSDAGCTNSNSERNNESRGLMDTTAVDLETLMTGTF